WSRAMLNEFRNNFFIGEHIRHAEIFYFYEKPPGEIRRPGNFVDQHERHSKISRFQRRASGSNNSNISVLHHFGRLADLDLKPLSILCRQNSRYLTILFI